MPSLNVFLFGPFEVTIDGQKIQHKLWQSRQVRDVFKVLIARRGKVTQSEQIIDILWPDDNLEIAQNRLYVRISQLRKLLDNYGISNLIHTVKGGYLIDWCNSQKINIKDEDQLWIDVCAFEDAADQGQQFLEDKQFQEAVKFLKQGRQLYRGEYLAQDLYEEWTIGERERLRERYLVVITELSEAYAQQGLYRHAINECQHLLSFEPWRESIFVRLMLYHYYAGNKAKALQTYEKCKQNLKTDLGLKPDPNTTWIAEQIRDGSLWRQGESLTYPPPAYEGRLFEVPYSLGEPPFTGRDREYAWLSQHWHSDNKVAIWITGDRGIGKTRLAEAFVQYLKVEGVEVIKLQGGTSHHLAHRMWIEAMDITAKSLEKTVLSEKSKAVLRVLTTAGEKDTPLVLPPGVTSGTFHAVNQAITELLMGKPNPVLIWADDANLLNEDSLNILIGLIGKIGLLITSQNGESGNDLPFSEFIEQAGHNFKSLSLKPWLTHDLRSFLGRLGGEDIQNLTENLLEQTEGNPLFLIASLQHLFEEGILYADTSGQWTQAKPLNRELPPNIEDMIAIRLQSLQTNERRLLDVLAVAGGESDYEILEDVLEREEHPLLMSVDHLISQGFIMEPRNLRAADVNFSHTMYRDVMYKTLPKARQRIFHRRIGEAMLKCGQDTPPNASKLAWHFHQGGADEKAIQYSKIAGDYARHLYQPKQALVHYKDALAWMENHQQKASPDFEALVRMGMAESQRHIGDYPQAILNYREAIPMLKGELKGAAVFQIFSLQILQGRPLSTYSDLAAEYELLLLGEATSWALVLFYWSQSYVALLGGSTKETRLNLAKGWRTARKLMAKGDNPPGWMLQRACSLMMNAHNQWSNYPHSIHFAEKNLSSASNNALDANTKAAVRASLGTSYFYLGHYQQAEENFKGCYDIALKAGDPRLQGEGLIGLANLYLITGEVDEAKDLANQVLGLCEERMDLLRMMYAQFIHFKIAILQGVEPEHITAMENILSLARYQEVNPYVAKCLLIMAEMQLALQQEVQAETYAQEALQMAEQCGQKREQSGAFTCLAQIKAQQGYQDEAYTAANKAMAIAKTIQAPYENALAMRARAFSQTDINQSKQDLEQALKLFKNINALVEIKQTETLLVKMSLNLGGN